MDKINEAINAGYVVGGRVAGGGNALVIKTNMDGDCPEAESPTVISVNPVLVSGTIRMKQAPCSAVDATPDTHYLAEPE